MTHQIFISYAAEDKTVADAVCAAIEAQGIACWYAPRNVAYGQDFEESIVDAIAASQLIILILTSHSNDSAHVKREIQNACLEEIGVPVLPFRVEDVPLNKALRYYIGSVHWLDAVTSPLEPHLQRLVEHVRARLPQPVETSEGEAESGKEKTAPPEAPARPKEKEQSEVAGDRAKAKDSLAPQPQVPNYLAPAIVASVFCCLPVGIASIVFSLQANSKAAAGEIEQAIAKARLARNLLITAIGIGLAAYVIFIVGILVGPYFSGTTGGQPNTNGPVTNINRNSASNGDLPPAGFPLTGLRVDIFYLAPNRLLAERLSDRLRMKGAQITMYDRTDGNGIFQPESAVYYYGEEADNAKKIADAVSDITFVRVGPNSAGPKHSDGIQFYLWVGKGGS